MQPISELLPKELVPLGARPVIDFVLEEAADGGIEAVGIVVREGKEMIGRYIESARRGTAWADLEVRFIDQPEPLGLGDAILCARDFVGDEPFALLLPDNVALSPTYRLADLIELQVEKRANVLGVLSVGHSQSGTYGRCGLFEGRDESDRVVHLRRIFDKEPGRIEVAAGETVERTCGRSVWHTDFLPALAAAKPQVDGDFDEVPIVQEIVADRGAWGLRLPGPLFDVGNPRGYLAASHWLFEHGFG